MCVCVRTHVCLTVLFCFLTCLFSVFVCVCHNKSLETRLSSFCVHASITVSRVEASLLWVTASKPPLVFTKSHPVLSIIYYVNGQKCCLHNIYIYIVSSLFFGILFQEMILLYASFRSSGSLEVGFGSVQSWRVPTHVIVH